MTCNAGSGVWSGSVTFTPPLSFSGAASHEVIKVVAKLGNTTSPCLTSSTPPAGNKVIGLIKGKAKFSGTAANNCAFVFSGSSNVPVAAAFADEVAHPGRGADQMDRHPGLLLRGRRPTSPTSPSPVAT